MTDFVKCFAHVHETGLDRYILTIILRDEMSEGIDSHFSTFIVLFYVNW